MKKRPLKHVKWAEKEMPDDEQQKAFEEACRARDKRRKVSSGKTHSAALKANARTVNHTYRINNLAELEYRGTLTDDFRK